MRFPNNYFYWFKRADVFPTLPFGLPAFFNEGCDAPSDETSDYGEAPSDDSSEDESSQADEDYAEVDTSSQAKAGTKTMRGSEDDN